ncbi:DUF3604 domain-containing protein [Sunxiuqinia sp. A32]|uniref:DUF3604 domain-containing protein n=1 Tax=Sunxiuqinia sp. A32 TaxID=3461496 RepID=UPI004045FEE3
MKRREFIKISSTAALSSAIPLVGFPRMISESSVNLKQNFLLKGFEDEQEEYPSLVTDGKGNIWIHALRRMSYPANAELISSFHYNGIEWKETAPVTSSPGQYESPVSACASGGKPVVAWTEIKDEDWVINTSMLTASGYGDVHSFPVKSGKSINPVLIAGENRNWIAWENLHDGRFTIYLSKYENGKWSDSFIVEKNGGSCFDPAIAEDKDGKLYLAYGYNQGYHQNIEMLIIDGNSLRVTKTIPVAVGGGLKNRANINSKPALAFDEEDRLWITYENNRNNHRLEDGDNYTGDLCCAILSYKDGKIVEVENTGKWLFTGKNDHKPTFIKDNSNHLYLVTNCGGDFVGNPFWQYRISWLDPQKGWSQPVTLLQTDQKGVLIPPAIAFDENNQLWLSTMLEKRFANQESSNTNEVVRSLLTQLSVQQYHIPKLEGLYADLSFIDTTVTEFLPGDNEISTMSGHPDIVGEQIEVNGEVYKLVYGNLHEHSEKSPCWPAGTDGTLHEDYRFGMFTENYDFVAITDHGYSMTEVYWRKNMRVAEFYNQPETFVALPAMEWTLSSNKELNDIEYGAGHYNVIFSSVEEGRKFIRNEQEIYSVYTPETNNSVALWKFLHEKNIDCISIPHHPADEMHPLDWDVHDDYYVPVVELFQCRGNNEYPGCPREHNLERHFTTKYKRAFVNYALKEKKQQMGFIASGDHNGMGVGVAAIWVKELNREGILEGLRSKRCFATTGDKMIIDFRMNGETSGSVVKSANAPKISVNVKGQRELSKVEILKNSKVIKEYTVAGGSLEFNEQFVDELYQDESDVLYYYVRVTQKNNEIGWSSPIWIDLNKA